MADIQKNMHDTASNGGVFVSTINQPKRGE